MKLAFLARQAREGVIAILVMGYLSVSVLVYSDEPRAERGPALGELETEGLEVWRRENCQACHQLHGFGGFLGPDLTNRIDGTRPDAEFRELLVSGYRRMPAFGLSARERAAVLAFLRAMNRSGAARPDPLPAPGSPPPPVHFEALLAGLGPEEVPGDVSAGCEAWTRNRCGSCHVPFAEGPTGAPDLAAASIDLDPSALAERTQSPGRRMPAFRLSEEEIRCLAAFLEWTRSNRTRLAEVNDDLCRKATFDWTRVPWFEFR